MHSPKKASQTDHLSRQDRQESIGDTALVHTPSYAGKKPGTIMQNS